MFSKFNCPFLLLRHSVLVVFIFLEIKVKRSSLFINLQDHTIAKHFSSNMKNALCFVTDILKLAFMSYQS